MMERTETDEYGLDREPGKRAGGEAPPRDKSRTTRYL
jgi:hypothetical protein